MLVKGGPESRIFCTWHNSLSSNTQMCLNALSLSKACYVCCVECVSRTRFVLSIIIYAIYWALCIQITYFAFANCERIYNLFSHHYQAGHENHEPPLQVWSIYIYIYVFMYWLWFWYRRRFDQSNGCSNMLPTVAYIPQIAYHFPLWFDRKMLYLMY